MGSKAYKGWQHALAAAMSVCGLLSPALSPQSALAQTQSRDWDSLDYQEFALNVEPSRQRPQPRPSGDTFPVLPDLVVGNTPKLRPMRRAGAAAEYAALIASTAPVVDSIVGELPPLVPVDRPDAAMSAPQPATPPALQSDLPQVAQMNDLQPPPEVTAVPLAPWPIVETAGYDSAKFLSDRAALFAKFTAAEGAEKAQATLDMSQLLLSQMLLPEAASFHARAWREGLQEQPELLRRWQAMGVMLQVLQGAPITEKIAAPWAEASLWGLAAGATADVMQDPLDLREAVALLQNHSEPVISRLLPLLFDRAMAQNNLPVAEGLLRGAREATRLPQEPIYHLMMGRMALAYDMPEEAFDYFARGANGRDLAAQRARIAMADLALHRKDPKLLPALRDILAEGVHQWRHDYEALILRARLAQVAEDLGDIPLALDIMGKIRQDHPGTPEAILAHERGALALAAFAVAVEAEAISLETYLVTLRDVEPFYRLDPVWVIARQALARAFTRAGLNVAAASEYSALQIDLHRIDAPVPPARQGAEIPLNEAEAWLLAYNTDRARLALAREGLPRFEDLQPRYNLAALSAGAASAGAVAPDFNAAEDLAIYARNARSGGLSSTALAAYRRMDLLTGFDATPTEGLQAVLLAESQGADDLAAHYFTQLQAGPAGAAFPARTEIFTALTHPQPDLQPLSRELADEMTARAIAAGDAAGLLLARPIIEDAPATEPESAK